MSRARDSIRNRRRNSSANTQYFSSSSSTSTTDYVHQRMSNMVVEEQNENEFENGYFDLKSRHSSTTDLSPNGTSSPIKTCQKKLATSTLKSSSDISERASESCESLGDQFHERKSLPERVNFAATWVSARLLKRHRERRARRLENENMSLAENPSEGLSNRSGRSELDQESAIENLSETDLDLCRSGDLAAVIANEACLAAFKEFLKKEHSDENLEFWLESEKYKNTPDQRQTIAKFILENFIAVSNIQYSL